MIKIESIEKLVINNPVNYKELSDYNFKIFKPIDKYGISYYTRSNDLNLYQFRIINNELNYLGCLIDFFKK